MRVNIEDISSFFFWRVGDDAVAHFGRSKETKPHAKEKTRSFSPGFKRKKKKSQKLRKNDIRFKHGYYHLACRLWIFMKKDDGRKTDIYLFF